MNGKSMGRKNKTDFSNKKSRSNQTELYQFATFINRHGVFHNDSLSLRMGQWLQVRERKQQIYLAPDTK
jgi:hypothetical protein